MNNKIIKEDLQIISIAGLTGISLQRNFGNQLGDITIEYSNDGEHWTLSTQSWVDADSDLLTVKDIHVAYIRLGGAFGQLNGELNNNGIEQISHVVLRGDK